MARIQQIIDWRDNAKKWDTCSFGETVTHEWILRLCIDVNTYYESIDCTNRVRKSWKAIEACTKGDEIL